MEHDGADALEAQGRVKIDRTRVRGSDVQPGTQAVASMTPYKMTDDIAREPLSAMRRMRADSAKFRVALEPQALTAHRDQLAVHPDTAVGPHAIRPRTKKTGKCNICERDHLMGICVGER
jgi:hypothetical protein